MFQPGFKKVYFSNKRNIDRLCDSICYVKFIEKD